MSFEERQTIALEIIAKYIPFISHSLMILAVVVIVDAITI